MSSEPEHVPHGKQKIAYHMEWEFREEAAVWAGRRAIRPNFYLFGTELRKWMLRKTSNMPMFVSGDEWYANPYTLQCSVLALAYREITNDVFGDPPDDLVPVGAEIRRVRLYSEFLLYTARLCEALVKQLLYVTTFPERSYRGAALGSLIAQECSGCRPSREKRHRLSLLGSLAHKYGLCTGYEKCLEELVPMVNQLRDTQAAHSGVEAFQATTSLDSKERLRQQGDKLGHEFIHMLEHIGEIETHMWNDMMSRITGGS
jgi:hypothetical protein